MNVVPATSRGAVDLLLVFGTVAMALGLAVVTASLTPTADAPGDPTPGMSRIVIAGGAAVTPAMFMDRIGKPDSRALPQASGSGPWKSPLYPQNGVTLWDRIRVSSKRDRRAFLLGSAILIHAPATAATPGPRATPPPCCPRQ